MEGINSFNDFIQFVSKLDPKKVKEINVRFALPDTIKSLNIEYFSFKTENLPGGVICE